MGRARLRNIAALLLGGATPLFARSPAAQDPNVSGDDVFLDSRPFSIPDKQGARALYDQAVQHVDAGRWTEAVTTIERLIEEHSGSVIALPSESAARRRSIQPVYRGAADAARELFTRIPAQARAAYSARYAARAQELFECARKALDTTALADMARRYPLTEAGRNAWWTLGDIEAEAGNIDAARSAWKRAGELLADDKLSSALALRARWSPGDGAIGASRASYFSLSASEFDTSEILAADAHGWEKPLHLDENQGTPFRQDNFNSFPIIVGDSALASNSLTLTCADALTGAVRWRSAEPSGWAQVHSGRFRARDGREVPFSGFFEGLDREGLMVAPAAGSGVAIAALQVPFTQNGNNWFQVNQIRITTVIPDRRLFAFDLESGKPLWDHCPPPTWDCDSGSFTQRMRVAGPPVIAGARVLVPMWRPQGRIYYCVACYDLSSGAYLWSTQVASGQRPLNMFGRLQTEFSAPPLLVVGEKVIALTQLGTIAALDLFSGEMLWQTVYDQIPIPAADGMQAGVREVRWRNTPPAVSDNVVVATPVDSKDMLGIDLNDGAVLWSLSSSIFGEASGRGPSWCLLGARDDTVYIGGRTVIALRAREGLSKGMTKFQTTRSDKIFGDGFIDPSRTPRAVLTARNVIAPTHDGTLILDRSTLQSLDGLSAGRWSDAPAGGWGNLAIGSGAMYALSGQYLWGVLDWRSIEARLENEYRQHPDDVALATRLGEFLRERASSERGAKPQAALGHLQRAEKVLEGPAGAGRPEARLALFETLRLEVKVLVANAQASLSLERLDRAVPLAPDPERLSLVLADIVRRARDADPQRFGPALGELERRCGDLEFPVEEGAPEKEARSVRRWVIEQRIKNAADHGDTSSEFAALIDLLDRCGDGPMSPAVTEPPFDLHETPAMRIEQRLASGARAAWQPFEEKARVALEAARSSADPAALERVARVFPHTTAARDSRDARLRLALDAGDSAAAVRAAFEELPDDWSAQQSTPRQARMLWLAAQALRADGNARYASSVLQRLAQFQPDVPVDPRDPRVTFATLAASAETTAPVAPDSPKAPRFDTPARELKLELGDCVLMGELDLGTKNVFILAGRDQFTAVEEDGTRLWTRSVEGAIAPTAWLSNALLVPGSPAGTAGSSNGARVVLTWRGGVQALDASSGEPLWSWEARGRLLDSALASEAGVLTISMSVPGTSSSLVGLDLGRGTPLWERVCPPDLWSQPVVGSGLAVLLPKLQPFHRAQVIELATGTLVRELDLGQIAPIEDRKAAWIENSRLVLPHFTASHAAQDALVAYDLDTGVRAWRVPTDDVRELDSIVRCGTGTYLVYRVDGSGSAAGNLKELDTRIGAVREIPGVSIGPSDVPIGLRQNGVTRLDAPYLFLRSAPDGNKDGILVRSVHLPYGQRWARRLLVAQNDLFSRSMPLPGISARLVAFVYMEQRPLGAARAQPKTHLAFFERDTGTLRSTTMGSRDLPPEMGRSEALEMATFGNLLILCGKDRTMILAGADSEEQR